VFVASTRYSGPRRVHLPGRGWAAYEFSKDLTSVLSGSISRQARWSESQQSRRRGWRSHGGLDEGRGSEPANWRPALDFFTRSSLTKYYQTWLVANTNTNTVQYRRRALYVFLALLSPVRVYKPLRGHLLSVLIEIRFSLLSGSCPAPSSSELAGTRLYSPASSR